MIIITTQCFAPEIGGIESLMTGMAEAIANEGQNLLVLADGSKQKKWEVMFWAPDYHHLNMDTVYAGVPPFKFCKLIRDFNQETSRKARRSIFVDHTESKSND